MRLLEHTVDLLFSLMDLSLGVAVLALNPGSPRELYNTLDDPKAPMTFQNYATLFLLTAAVHTTAAQREGEHTDFRVAPGNSARHRQAREPRSVLFGVLEDRFCEAAPYAVDAYAKLLYQRRECG